MPSKSPSNRIYVARALISIFAITALLFALQACKSDASGSANSGNANKSSASNTTLAPKSAADTAASKAAFLSVYKVLVSPRCVNCHPAADAPLQGDDAQPHAQMVVRGPDGHGGKSLRCSDCHQNENTPGPNMPPGNPKWALPPPSTPMVFQGRTPAQLSRQLLDPKQNGGRTADEILKHMTSDDLVLWAWNPGEGRTLPPLSQAEFAAKVREWIEKGAASPD